MRIKVFIGFLFISVLTSFKWQEPLNYIYPDEQETWVDSVYNSLSLDEKFGQLFMVAAYSNLNEKHIKEIEKLITDYKIGGLIFMQGGPYRQSVLTNKYQSLSKVPLMIAMDAEWGPSMRLDSVTKFPRQMVLGAMENDSVMYQMGQMVAQQLSRIGVHINFAPVIDVNSNPNNPVIGTRSFGENKYRVSSLGIAYTKGMQDNHVMAVAKHFPGHGDTGSDSHLTLPVLNHSKERMSDIELFPFRELFKEGVKGVMVAHLHVPVYDNRKNQATTLSEYVVTDLLQKEMNFKGLIFTDALGMQGVAKFHKPGEVDFLAYMAGNDVLLFSEDVPTAIKKLNKAYKRKKITDEDLENRVKKILRAKYWFGLHNYKPISLENLNEDMNQSAFHALLDEIYFKATTLVRNEKKLLPIQDLKQKKFASLTIGEDENIIFQEMLDNYIPHDHFVVANKKDEKAFLELKNQLAEYELITISLRGMNNSRKYNYGLSNATLKFLNELEKIKDIIIAVHGNGYALKNFEKFNQVICTYDDKESARKVVPQLIFGAAAFLGKTPVSASSTLKEGTGIQTKSLNRLTFTYPENAQLSSKTLSWIDTICNVAIKEEATPGCQVLVAKDGKVVFQKPYGYFTYKNEQKIENTTLYDLASITKVASTLQSVMYLEERGLIDIEKKASEYLPELEGTNKEFLTIKQILSHQAGLTPWIPHWRNTLDKQKQLNSLFYSKIPDSLFTNYVCNDLYCIRSSRDSLWYWTIISELREPINLPVKKRKRKKFKLEDYEFDYKYSDLGFYIMREIVERITEKPIEIFVEETFYEPMGASTLGYLPLNKFSKDIITPTEDDKLFRKQQIHGFVHDQGAALMYGVGGHAGLFSNALDLAKLLQMNLQSGVYGGDRYLQDSTVSKFNTRYFLEEENKNRRGLGWDKPVFEDEKGGPTSNLVSQYTYGHTGFTGTAAWVDPEYKLVYIFLSNRVHPNADNKKLINGNYRTDIQEIIYKSMQKHENK